MADADRTVESLWLEDEVNKRYLQWSKKKKVNIFLGTWNVNAKSPKDEIDSWLLHSDFKPDLYVLGFQEIVDLNAANLWIENDANIGWEDAIGKSIGSEYELIATKHLVGILIVIFGKKTICPYLSDCMTSSHGCGLFGSAGNKGGCGVHLKIFDSTVTFISSHLAAHKNNVQGRNQDHLKILENLEFDRSNNDDHSNNYSSSNNQHNGNDPNADNPDGGNNDHDNGGADGGNGAHAKSNSNANNLQFRTLYGGNNLSIRQHHDMVFWIGDLNYRLNFDDLNHVYNKVDEGDWKYLLTKDQLNLERKGGRSWKEFMEAEIDFQPTYKFQTGTSLYEKRPEKKTRFPAWCDRILWRRGKLRTSHIDDVKCLKYSCSMSQTMSDHKPVYAFVEFMANEFDLDKKNQVREDVMRGKDRSDNNMLPKINIPCPEVSFPTIKYGQEYRKEFIIENSGQVPARFKFVKEKLPSWLSIDPIDGFVLHQQSESVIFKITVSADNVSQIMQDKNKMEATVVLIFDFFESDGDENPQDSVMQPTKFVDVKAEYLPSCFGNKIENLVKYRQPIRFIEFNENGDALNSLNAANGNNSNLESNNNNDNGTGSGGGTNNDNGSNQQKNDLNGGANNEIGGELLSLPKELWRLVDHLYKYGMDTADIFLTQGPTKEISDIRECLDTGKEFGRYELHSVGEALVRFLESTQLPIFPASLCDTFKPNSNMNVTQWCRQALINLPLSHYNAFIYIVSFLREVLKHSQRNKLTPEKLACQFSIALMHKPIPKQVDALSKHKPFQILLHFLTNIEGAM